MMLKLFTGSFEFSRVGVLYIKLSRQKNQNTPIYFNTNYRTEMKLVPIIMDYSLHQFDAIKFFLGVRLHGVLYLTLVFSM